jgi:hypothetical protein
MEVHLGLLDVNELSSARRHQCDEHRKALRDAESNVGDAYEIPSAASGSLFETPDAEFDTRIVDASCLDLPIETEFFECDAELLKADVFGHLPLMDNAGDVRLECPWEIGACCGGSIGSLGIAMHCGHVNHG